MSFRANDLMDDQPWYRQGWPWFLISIPAASVVLGFHLLYLAHKTNNSLVVDDYYKQGKSIAQYALRDRTTAILKLSAEITASDEGIKLQLSQMSDAPRLRYPEALNLRWVHVTQAHKDGELVLKHYGGGWYFDSDTELPNEGTWRFHVEPVVAAPGEHSDSQAADWRLVSNRVSVNSKSSVTIDYRP